MSDPIRWFIGTSANGEDIEFEIALEYSARKLCSLPIEITWMRQAKKGPYAGWQSSRIGRTPFSGYRWSPPAMCGFEGRALYTDVDFLLLADLADLWTQPIPGVVLSKQSKGKFGKNCCMLFDCAKAKGHIPDLDTLKQMADPQGTLSKYFRERPELSSGFDGNWNCIDGDGLPLGDPRMKALHFSRMENQPHLLKYAQPRLKAEGRAHWYTGPVFPHPRPELQALFDATYAEALAAGYAVDQYRTEGFEGATRRAFTYKHHVGAPV